MNAWSDIEESINCNHQSWDRFSFVSIVHNLSSIPILSQHCLIRESSDDFPPIHCPIEHAQSISQHTPNNSRIELSRAKESFLLSWVISLVDDWLRLSCAYKAVEKRVSLLWQSGVRKINIKPWLYRSSLGFGWVKFWVRSSEIGVNEAEWKTVKSGK